MSQFLGVLFNYFQNKYYVVNWSELLCLIVVRSFLKNISLNSMKFLLHLGKTPLCQTLTGTSKLQMDQSARDRNKHPARNRFLSTNILHLQIGLGSF